MKIKNKIILFILIFLSGLILVGCKTTVLDYTDHNQIEERIYDGDKKIVEYNEYNHDWRLNFHEEIKYDKQDRVITYKSYYYDNDEELSSYIIRLYSYNEITNETIIDQTIYDKDGNITGHEVN